MSATATLDALGSAAAPARRPWIGILAVLLGAAISTLNGRLSTFGLADVRGAVGAGFDDGAWITTAQTVAQMLIGPPTVWLAATFGVRRVLLVACPVFAATSLALPFSPDLRTLLALQFVGGLASGTFVPVTISFVLRSLPPALWAWGIAAYALNLEFSLNVAASLEGWYTDHASWAWIFWQNVPLALAMTAAVWIGVPREPVNRALLGDSDPFGRLFAGMGFALIYAALDQGNRLDWLHSGLVVGLFAGGTVLLAAFGLHLRTLTRPTWDLGLAVRGDIPLLMLLLVLLRLGLLATAYVVPQFLTQVQGYRALQVGDALLWVALPQLLVAPLGALLLRRLDARMPVALGFALIALACWMVATGLTHDWVSADFAPSQLLQAVGQTLALSGVIFLAVQSVKPEEALTFGFLLQTVRLFGGELGIAFIATWVRVREQVASYLVGLHVTAGDVDVTTRLNAYAAAVAPRSGGSTEAAARAVGLLDRAVRTQAQVLSYIDAFAVLALGAALALLLVALLRPPPVGPASPRPLFRRWGRARAASR